jgi:DNA transformation protein and related proteins
LRIKRMFGGAGIYSGDLFFAILVEDTFYLKVDDGNRGAYQDLGIQPFSYEGKDGRRATMSYYPVPSELLDDPDALAPWVRQALDAAQRAGAKQAGSGRKVQGFGRW